jgi:hypothetical protein
MQRRAERAGAQGNDKQLRRKNNIFVHVTEGGKNKVVEIYGRQVKKTDVLQIEILKKPNSKPTDEEVPIWRTPEEREL